MTSEQTPSSDSHACAISGRPKPRHDLLDLETVRPSLSDRIRREHPHLPDNALVSKDEIARYRAAYIEDLLRDENGEMSELERKVAESLATNATLAENVEADYEGKRSLGELLSDHIASFGGSWMFIISFGLVMAAWIGLNLVQGAARAPDPYPFILLNLILSALAAIQAPIIMMSQKRQEQKDRLRSLNDYKVNLKAELEIRHLHEKVDHLLNKQWQRLIDIQKLQLEIMQERRQ